MGTHHYVVIKDLNKLVSKMQKRKLRSRNTLCRNCFHRFSSEERLERHQLICMGNEPAIVTMPNVDKSSVGFKNIGARSYSPFAVYFDLESVLEKVETVRNNPNCSSTTVIEKHKPSSFCLVVVEAGNPKPAFFSLHRGVDAMTKFVRMLEVLARDFHNKKRRYPNYLGSTTILEDSDKCWICKEEFSETNAKVLDHNHFDGSFLGWAHNKCNFLRRTIQFTPVFAHNLQNYDLHHVLKSLQDTNTRNTFLVIPLNDEKFISLTRKVWIRSYTNEKGNVYNVYEEIRFVDSCKFMNSSLDELARNLPVEKFIYLNNHFATRPEEDKALIRQKGYFPYSYVDSHARYTEDGLPARDKWTNTLQGGVVSVSEKEYQHAWLVYTRFGCQTLGEYSDLYLTTDTLILACVFEEFRRVCYETYKLDCAQYFTVSNLSGDAFLRTCKADLHLLTNREHLDMAENLIRGGIASVFEKRLVSANNKFVKNYDPKQPNTFLFMIDANNLYGGIMEKFPLPLNSFEFNDQVTIAEILNTSRESEIGYILDVDLLYPDHLHDAHSDYPLAPTKEVVSKMWLSELQLDMLKKINISDKVGTTPKLIQNFFPKKNYTVHYLTLQLYVKLGLKIEKVNRVLQFRQEKFIAPYVQLNTELRKKATTKFEQDFFKQIINSAFGKFCESKRNRLIVDIVRNAEELQNLSRKKRFSSIKIIDQHLVSVSSKPVNINWDKPTIVGATILDLAKFYMFQFHYNIIKKNFDATLLYSDTDSFLYEIRSKDLYKEIEKNH